MYEFRQLDERGAINGTTVLSCENEADAIEHACQLAQECDVEVWLAGERVTIVTAAKGAG